MVGIRRHRPLQAQHRLAGTPGFQRGAAQEVVEVTVAGPVGLARGEQLIGGPGAAVGEQGARFLEHAGIGGGQRQGHGQWQCGQCKHQSPAQVPAD
jgi:hypothetical protein